MREADLLAVQEDFVGLVELRDACLEATEETGRQLWGPARYAAYRVALDGPAELAGAMLEPGVVRFGLGPLTEVVAQHHTVAELAPHVDAALLPVVAQERVLRGEDLRGDPRAEGASDDPPLVLQPFEPAYTLPEYRATERLDGSVPEASPGREVDVPDGSTAPVAALANPVPTRAAPVPTLARALEDAVAPWTAQSGGEAHVRAVHGDVVAAVRSVASAAGAADGTDEHLRELGLRELGLRELDVPELFARLAHAGASGGVHGRRRGGAAGRSLAWWIARCATGLDREEHVDADELEFRLEDVRRVAFRLPGEAAWRLEVALGGPGGPGAPGPREGGPEWAVAIAAFDRAVAPEEQPGTAPW